MERLITSGDITGINEIGLNVEMFYSNEDILPTIIPFVSKMVMEENWRFDGLCKW